MKTNQNITHIYGLIDPRTNELRYVGKTTNLNRRIKEHINGCNKDTTHKNCWISELICDGLKPIMCVIDSINTTEWEFWEIHYISYFKSIGCRLTNTKKGGQSPTFITSKLSSRKGKCLEEIYGDEKGKVIKDKIRISSTKRSDYPQGKDHWNYGKHASNITKEKISKIKKISQFGVNNPMYGKHVSDQNKQRSSKLFAKKVIQLNLNGDVIKIWDSITLAKKTLNIKGGISNVCYGKQKTAGGYKWKYYNK